MIELFSWWLSVSIVGLAALPLTLRWLRWLPDRGYIFAKPLGILLLSYLLWLGATLGIVDNTTVTIGLLLVGLGVACWLRYGGEAISYWREHRRFVLGIEALFAVALVVWAVVRAYNPEISATEKPMEIAFLSSAMRSVQFPPVDPWLSGYGISYYYLGYVMMAVLGKLAGLSAPYVFNLAIALVFALTVAGTFSLGYNLVARSRGVKAGEGRGGAVICGALASVLVAISANLEGIFEMLNARGMLSPGFLQWLHIKDMPTAAARAGWLPADNWWWFRASRVIGDFDLASKASRDYTINEFPFFSFMLGDLHPHLLALPFAVLSIAVCLNLVFSGEEWSPTMLRRQPLTWLVLGLVFGGLGFLNSWDMPTYLLLFVAAYAVHRYSRQRRLDWALLKDALHFGGLILLASIVLYLPFYIGFRSQAAGLGVVAVRSKLHHFAIFWGPLFFLLVSWLVARAGNRSPAPNAAPRKAERVPASANRFASVIDSPRQVMMLCLLGLVAVGLVLVRAEVAAVLLVLMVLGGALLWQRLKDAGEADAAGGFVFLLMLVGMLLVFICEWLFIRDYFNNRMNTVFKLYYQAWLMLAVAGAYVLYYLAIRPRAANKGGSRLGRVTWQVAAGVMLAVSLVYPVAATISKTDGFAKAPTLDGQAFMARSQPDDNEAIRWLQANVTGTPVIVEGTGGSYGPAGRVSAFTGLPTLLGWDFHEQQWRGSFDEPGKRKADIEAIYSSSDRTAAEALLRKYGVSYVYVGPYERENYAKFGPAALAKFATFMDVVHQNNGVTIYKMKE